jgi:hypothetical protein
MKCLIDTVEKKYISPASLSVREGSRVRLLLKNQQSRSRKTKRHPESDCGAVKRLMLLKNLVPYGPCAQQLTVEQGQKVEMLNY